MSVGSGSRPAVDVVRPGDDVDAPRRALDPRHDAVRASVLNTSRVLSHRASMRPAP